MADQNEAKSGKVQTYVGYGMSALVTLGLLASAGMKLSQNPQLVHDFTEIFGYPAASLVVIGVVELLIAILYAVPKTSYLGAVLVVGYLGGAVATHVRVSQPFFFPLLLGILAWGGLYLRDARLRALLPLNK